MKYRYLLHVDFMFYRFMKIHLRKMPKKMILIGLCVLALVHYSCQDLEIIPKIELDEYNIPIVEESIFEHSIFRFRCLGKQLKLNLNTPSIDMISACFSDPDSIDYIKTISKTRISEGKARPEQLEFLRCLGSIIVTQSDITQDLTRYNLYECLLHYKIEKYIDWYIKEKYRYPIRHEFTEFLLCLAATNEVDFHQEATDCIQTNPILIQIGKKFRNPFPGAVGPPPALKSGGQLMTDSYHISSSQNEEVAFSDSYYVDYVYYE